MKLRKTDTDGFISHPLGGKTKLGSLHLCAPEEITALIADGWIAEHKPKRYEYRGEYRCPREGEYYITDNMGEIDVAEKDYAACKYPILHELPELYTLEQIKEAIMNRKPDTTGGIQNV